MSEVSHHRRRLSPLEQIMAMLEKIKRALSRLRSTDKELATKLDLIEVERHIMGEIQDLHAAQTAAFERMKTALEDLTKDSAFQTAKIIELQNSAQELTPEDKALVSELKENAETMATKLEELAAIVDSSTPVPEEPTPEEPTPEEPPPV